MSTTVFENIPVIAGSNGINVSFRIFQANSTLDLQVETDQKTTTTALTVVEGSCSAATLTPTKNVRSGSVTSTHILNTRATSNRSSTRRQE